jgi:quercetin dioxygenase-like cupin family protein
MARRKAEQSVGQKITRLRKDRLTITELANETGLTADFIQKVETGEVLPPVGVLLRISKALSIDSASLFSGEAEKEASEKRRRSFMKRTQEYSYQVLTPAAENKHLKAFHVTIEPREEHRMVEYSHEGEEFLYVLKGKIEVLVGENSNILKRGESLHFNSAIVHKVKNLGSEPAKMIAVIYTP